uniref:Ras-related protein Rab-43 n=1 Tax=Macrostomum lignano TaxID=282301 RepID=A0A1I8HF31_9PLAT
PDDQFDYQFKLVIVGDASVGKSCIVQCFKTGNYCETQASTIGVDFAMKTLLIDGVRVKLQIWDTAGHERFRTITQSYYRSASAAIIAYDITRRETFDSLHRWVEDLNRYAGSQAIHLLIGCKCDLESQRQVSAIEGREFANRLAMLAHLETSAKDNCNVDRLFHTVAEELLNRVRLSPPALAADNDRLTGHRLSLGGNRWALSNCCSSS